MDYRLELLDESTFEDLVNTICQKILGIGMISFSQGKDGGRDGKFTGTAQDYPDNVNPWSGRFIIQAKWTGASIASCSDSDFDKIVKNENVKIKKLKDAGDVDCYMLFTNRKYSGVKGEELLKKIVTETGVERSVIIGKETINDRFLNQHKEIVRQYRLDLLHIPFDFSDDEIKDIILTFKQQLQTIETEIKAEVDRIKHDFVFIDKKVKNKKNRLGEDYFQNEIAARSLMDFEKIERFLALPQNEEIKDYYFDVVSELSNLITIKRDSFDAFEEIFLFIYKMICDGSKELKGTKRHVTTFLHYMYYNCEIGLKE
jgi:hypothetical protein